MVDSQLLSDAADLFNRKLYFECHELLEDAWMEALGEEKQFLQGLIMLSVGMYHVGAGNYRGAVNVFEKGLARLEPFLPERDGVDLDGLTAASRRALEKAKRGLEGKEVSWTEEDIPQMRARSRSKSRAATPVAAVRPLHSLSDHRPGDNLSVNQYILGEETMRLVTRGNLDGLCCAVLITEAESIGSIELIHPQDITDGSFPVQPGDILANLPYHPECLKWFDHHVATRTYESPPASFEGRFGLAPSSARLVYTYYRRKHPKLERFKTFLDDVDRFTGATLKREDVTDPRGYILLGFTLDPRSGLGPYKDYFVELIDVVKSSPVEEILQLPMVRERVERIAADRQAFLDLMKRRSRQEGNVIVTDLRDENTRAVGNRFLVYTLFPEANVSLRIDWGPQRKFVVATVGHNIFNRTCRVHVGELMAKYGGGGHGGAGATPLATEKADELVGQIIEDLKGKA